MNPERLLEINARMLAVQAEVEGLKGENNMFIIGKIPFGHSVEEFNRKAAKFRALADELATAPESISMSGKEVKVEVGQWWALEGFINKSSCPIIPARVFYISKVCGNQALLRGYGWFSIEQILKGKQYRVEEL